MIKIIIDGKEVNISVNGKLTDIIRDTVIAVDKLGDAIAEGDEDAAKVFNHTIAMFAIGKILGIPVSNIVDGKADDSDEKKVTVDDLIKDLKEHEEHK